MSGDAACFRCGVCCIAPDISTLRKPARVRCQHLTENNLCSIYDSRPAVCRTYLPDALCEELQRVPPAERVDRYLKVFGVME